MSLEEIFKRYENWDNHLGTDKGVTHSYIESYESLFAPRKTDPLTLLEIGIFSGASLAAWDDYFSNDDARIIGIDITLSNLKFATDRRKVKIAEMDGTDPLTPVLLNQKYDIIIEDGSHKVEDQIRSLALFAPYLNPGGVYIAEDISQDSLGILLPIFEQVSKHNGLSMKVVDLRHVKGRYDDILVIFQK